MRIDRTPRVLIVEDELLIALDIETVLSLSGVDCVGQAACSKEAIKLINELQPDICLLDLNLKDGPTGPRVAESIKVEAPNTSVIFMTANRSSLPHHLHGAVGVISKPYTDRGLIDAVSYVFVRGWCETHAAANKPHYLELRQDNA